MSAVVFPVVSKVVQPPVVTILSLDTFSLVKKFVFAGEYQNTVKTILSELEKRKMTEMTEGVVETELNLITKLLQELGDLLTFSPFRVNGKSLDEFMSAWNEKNLGTMVSFLEVNFNRELDVHEKEDGFFVGAVFADILMSMSMGNSDSNFYLSAEKQLISEKIIEPLENLEKDIYEKWTKAFYEFIGVNDPMGTTPTNTQINNPYSSSMTSNGNTSGDSSKVPIGPDAMLPSFQPFPPMQPPVIPPLQQIKLELSDKVTAREMLILKRMKEIKLKLVNFHQLSRQHFGIVEHQYMKWKAELYLELTKVDSNLGPYKAVGTFLVAVLTLFISVGLPLLVTY